MRESINLRHLKCKRGPFRDSFTSLLIRLSLSTCPFLIPLYLLYHRSLYYYHLLFLSNYPAILLSLSSRVSLFALSSPYHLNSASLPLCHFFLPFRYASPPSSPRSPSDLPHGDKKGKGKSWGCSWIIPAGGMHRRDDDGVATPPKMLMRQSIHDFRRRKKFFGVSRRLYQSSKIHPPSILLPLKSQDETAQCSSHE